MWISRAAFIYINPEVDMTLMLKEIQSQPAVLERVLSHNLDKTRQLCREIKKRGIKFFYIAARGTSDHALS